MCITARELENNVQNIVRHSYKSISYYYIARKHYFFFFFHTFPMPLLLLLLWLLYDRFPCRKSADSQESTCITYDICCHCVALYPQPNDFIEFGHIGHNTQYSFLPVWYFIIKKTAMCRQTRASKSLGILIFLAYGFTYFEIVCIFIFYHQNRKLLGLCRPELNIS